MNIQYLRNCRVNLYYNFTSYLNTFKINIVWFSITKHVINFPKSQIIFLLLILIIIAQLSIIFTLLNFTYIISNFHITTVRCLLLNLPVNTDNLICSLKLVEIVWVLGWYYFLNMGPSFNFFPDGKSTCTLLALKSAIF